MPTETTAERIARIEHVREKITSTLPDFASFEARFYAKCAVSNLGAAQDWARAHRFDAMRECTQLAFRNMAHAAECHLEALVQP